MCQLVTEHHEPVDQSLRRIAVRYVCSMKLEVKPALPSRQKASKGILETEKTHRRLQNNEPLVLNAIVFPEIPF